jgi:membrane protein implicated in regulation of membrane protease activity
MLVQSLMYMWWTAAVVLIAGELALPGFFLLWIGLAAGAMGLTTLMVPGMGLLAQVLLFGCYTFSSCYLYARFLRKFIEKSSPDGVGLNKRGDRMVGQIYVLAVPIVNGHGKANVGDGQWLVTGSDMPIGTNVIVRRVDGTTLEVEDVNSMIGARD